MSFNIKTTDGVNVRSGPGIEYERIDGMDSDASANVVGIQTDANGTTWYQTSSNGWVCADYCTSVTDNNPSATKDITSTAGNVTAASTTDKIKGEVANNIKQGAGLDSGTSAMLDQSLSNEKQSELLKKRIFGLPHQFLPETDIRPDGGVIGRVYGTNILGEAPILSIMPGKPNYLPSLSGKEKEGMINALSEAASETTEKAKDLAKSVINNGQMETKYFGFLSDHVNFMNYVNTMCRAAAVFMGIGDKNVPGTQTKYKEYRWENFRVSNTLANNSTSTQASALTQEDVDNKVQQLKDNPSEEIKNEFMSAVSTEPYYIDFYVTPATSYSESMTNRTEASMFENLVNKGEGIIKELSFLMGAGGIDKSVLEKNQAKLREELSKTNQEWTNNKDGVISRILTGSTAILTGSNIVFPEIWHESEFSRSYRAELKLISPYADKESIFLNCFVPMFHVLGFVLPRQTTANSYESPFLLKAHCGRWFSCEMGVMDSVEINKGGQGDAWSVDGFPTEITINISFKDLYSSLMMSKVTSPSDAYMFLWNEGFLEYLSLNCGLDLKKSEWKTKLDFAESVIKNQPADLMDTKLQQIREEMARMGMKIMLGGRI